MSNKLYLIGGAGRIHTKDKTTTSLASIDLWDTKLKEWEKISEMTIPRHGHALAYLGTQILIIGGVTTIYMRALSNIECFCGSRGNNIKFRNVISSFDCIFSRLMGTRNCSSTNIFIRTRCCYTSTKQTNLII